MENIKENRTVLTEKMFTHVCKIGFISIDTSEFGRTDINFYKADILQLIKGEILNKELGTQNFKFALQITDIEMIKEIVKRSPIFYELLNQF